VDLATTLPSRAEANERVELYLYSLLGLNGLYRNPFIFLFSNIFHRYSSLKARDRVLHPYKRTNKIMVLHNLTFIIQIANRKTKDSGMLERMESGINSSEWQLV
jgi:hypothetical protein